MKDVLGQALLDYQQGNYKEDIITSTNISEDDVLPLPYLFRDIAVMPSIEKVALKQCKGHVLDIGCGSGSHSLILQKRNIEVTAMDISKGACEVAQQRGVKQVTFGNVLKLKNATFDTLLLLMNGTGIFGKLTNVSDALAHLKTLLNSNGQILIDSSDLIYMYEDQLDIETEPKFNLENKNGLDSLNNISPNKETVLSDDGSDILANAKKTTSKPKGVWVPGDHYYGELTFTMKYKKIQTAPFSWLYLDESLFETAAITNGFTFEILERGDHYDYLARLTIAGNTL